MAGENPDPKTGEVNLFDPAIASCPQPLYRRLREQCPVARQAFVGGPVISRYEDVMWALRHPEVFSSEMEIAVGLGTERPMIPQQIDPPAQTRYRKILDPQFSRRHMNEIEPQVRADARQLAERVASEGSCEFNREFAIPLPCNAFLHLMGLPPDELDTFLELKDGIIRPHTRSTDMEEVARIRAETGKRIYQTFEGLIDDRRARPRDDLMTYLVQVDLDGTPLSRNEILDICFLFLLAGLDTVTATLGCSIAYLAANAEQRRRLVEDPALIPGAVEELLRWETPVTAVPRLVKQDVTIAGTEIKKGELATLLIGAANLDESEFERPDDVDFDRESNRHLAFGAGAHRCLGSHLARMEMRVALEEWHRVVPDYQIAPGETPRYSPAIREVQYLPLVWKVA